MGGCGWVWGWLGWLWGRGWLNEEWNYDQRTDFELDFGSYLYVSPHSIVFSKQEFT